MRNRFILLVIFFILGYKVSSGQDLLSMKTETPMEASGKTGNTIPVFEFKAFSFEYELAGISEQMAGKHPFGSEIAKKCYLLDKEYTSQVQLAPGNPATKTVIRKPVIYNAVKLIEKDLKRSVKKEEISVDIAVGRFDKVLDVALNILSENTREFEKAIESSGSVSSKEELFTKRVILN